MFQINQHIIKNYNPPFIISEAGLNHNGDLEKAFEMIELAKASGSDAVKFQTYVAKDFISDLNQTYTYYSQGKEITESMITMFERCEFSREEWFQIKEKCMDENIIFLSTPVNSPDVKLLQELNVPAIKIGSSDLLNFPLLDSCKNTGLPLIISCGMSELTEIFNSITRIGGFDETPVAILLCTSEYPTPQNDVNLKRFETFRKAFSLSLVKNG